MAAVGGSSFEDLTRARHVAQVAQQMDKSRYPFNKAAPRSDGTGPEFPFSGGRFPAAGAGEPLRGLTLTRANQKQAAAWYVGAGSCTHPACAKMPSRRWKRRCFDPPLLLLLLLLILLLLLLLAAAAAAIIVQQVTSSLPLIYVSTRRRALPLLSFLLHLCFRLRLTPLGELPP